MAQLAVLPTLTALRTLRLQAATALGTGGLATLARLPALADLEVDGAPATGDDTDLSALAPLAPRLERLALTLWQDWEPTDAVAVTPLSALTRLTSLRLAGLFYGDGERLHALVALRELDLLGEGWSAMRGRTARAGGLAPWPRLDAFAAMRTFLSPTDGRPAAVPAGLARLSFTGPPAELASTLAPGLTRLSLGGHLDVVGPIAALSPVCSQLRHLELDLTRAASPKAVAESLVRLAAGAPTLVHLGVRGMQMRRHVLRRGFVASIAAHPQLSSLELDAPLVARGAPLAPLAGLTGLRCLVLDGHRDGLAVAAARDLAALTGLSELRVCLAGDGPDFGFLLALTALRRLTLGEAYASSPLWRAGRPSAGCRRPLDASMAVPQLAALTGLVSLALEPRHALDPVSLASLSKLTGLTEIRLDAGYGPLDARPPRSVTALRRAFPLPPRIVFGGRRIG